MQRFVFSLRAALRLVCMAFLLWFCAGNLWAEDPSPLHIPRVTRAPRLDDFILGRPREAEVAISVFTQFDPHDGEPVSQPTTAYLSYDDHNLYVGWICKDDPKLIRARVAPRKMIETDDRVTINIDTFQDRKHAYWFDVNPYGVQYDGRTTDGIGDDSSWEGLWYSDGRIVNDGYVILQAIPFRTLRFPKGPKQVWNIVLGRFIERNNEMSLWPAVNHAHLPAFVGQYAPVVLEGNIVPGHNIQLIPYGLISNDHYLNSDTGWKQEDEYRPGLDAKMVLDGAFTLDFTANPDFSEIGSDDPKVTANQRFEVVFPERRPFFLENTSAFATPENLFFSRRIIDPQFGLKLTGAHGPWAAGALVADDRAPGKLATAGQPGHGERAYNGVARVEREVGSKGSHVGAFVSDRIFNGDFNRVGSIDTRILLPHTWSMKGSATTSQNQTAGAYSAGPGYTASLKKNDNHTNLGFWYTDRSPGLDPVLGYMDRTDIRAYENSSSYEWKPAHNKLLAFGPGIFTSVIYDHEQTLQNWYIKPSFNWHFKGMTSITVWHSESYERYLDTDLRQNYSTIAVSSQWFKWMDLSSRYSWGAQANYDAPVSMKPYTGNNSSAATTLTVYPSTHLRMDGIYYYTRMASEDAAHAQNSANSVIYTNHVLRSKLNYQFTRDYSFHAILDYNSMLPNQALITDSYAKNADTTLLFTYMPHPGTAVYMGYSTNYENATWNDNGTPQYQRINDPTTQSDRQFFFKVSYLFNF